MSSWNSRFSRVRSRVSPDLVRRASDYLWPNAFPPTATFNASDALSLGTLVSRSRGGWRPHVEFYGAAYRSVTAALKLEAPERLPRWLRRPRMGAVPTEEVAAVLQLVRVREAFIATQDEYGDMLEGDRWGLGRNSRPGPETRAAVESARRWYDDTGDRLLLELHHLDAALCAVLGWNLDASITFRTLRSRHGFPDVAAANGDY